MLVYVAFSMVRRRSRQGHGSRRRATRPSSSPSPGSAVADAERARRGSAASRRAPRLPTSGTCRRAGPGRAGRHALGPPRRRRRHRQGARRCTWPWALPLRAATATSNLTIGVTASASAALYLLRDAIDPLVAAPVLVGIFLGATAAARLAPSRPGRGPALDLRRGPALRRPPDAQRAPSARRRLLVIDPGAATRRVDEVRVARLLRRRRAGRLRAPPGGRRPDARDRRRPTAGPIAAARARRLAAGALAASSRTAFIWAGIGLTADRCRRPRSWRPRLGFARSGDRRPRAHGRGRARRCSP